MHQRLTEAGSKPMVAYTGAGISLSSGIPTFVGKGSLSDQVPLIDSFPGKAAEWMVDRPLELAKLLGHFQASFVTAAPTSAHYALAELENKRIVKHVVTGNGDHLHERAGSRQVHYKSSQHFVGSKEGWGWIAEGEFLLVAGIGRDEHGIISWARDHNIQIVVVSPDIPSFLHAQDWYVDGKAEDVLGQLSQDLPALDVEAVRSPPSCTKG